MRLRPARSARSQRGAALILFATVLVLGVAWYAIGALGKAAPSAAEREIRTGLALQAAKQALLAYVAQYAARTTGAGSSEPGQMPCPELLDSIGKTNEGLAATSCSNSADPVGRLPWRTLGVDPIRDGDGEPLWYALSRGFRSVPINFGTPGQLSYNGTANAAVALIIAPGRALNTLSDSGTPPGGCSKVNQQVSNRNTAALNPANFLECGNATGSYANLGTSPWTNDRVITITAAEWADAISAPVADRLQRQVAPALAEWDQDEFTARGKSWGTTHSLPYLPFASTFSDPATNDYCGATGASPTRDGLPPIASESSASCSSDWTGSASLLLQLLDQGCTPTGTELVCEFLRLGGVPPISARITATAPKVAGSFRGTIRTSDITVSEGGSANLFLSLSSTTGNATATIDVSWPVTVSVGLTVRVRIPNLPDAAVLSDARLSWFLTNNWQRYTYYAVAPGATVGSPPPCAPGSTCLTVNGLPTSTGNTNDKRLVLALMGRPLASQSQPSDDWAQYLESRVSATVFDSSIVTSMFNDRLAACPFHYTPQSGTPIAICN